MIQQALYLRRGVAWQPVLGCCAAAVVGAGLLHLFPTTAIVVLPMLLASVAAAAAHVFDEPATSVVVVTPRGTWWRGATRLLTLLLPLGLWGLLVAVRPGDVVIHRPGWLLLGSAVIVLVAGVAALASRHDHPAPGHVLAGLVVVTVVCPVIVAGFLDLATPYPLAGFPAGVQTFWVAVAAVAGAACIAALRPGVRR